jgi:hypothetical protein
MHSKPPVVLSLGVVQHLSVVLLSFIVPARSTKPPAFKCPPKIARSVVVEASYLGHSAIV